MNPETSNQQTVETIPIDALISVSISGGFYSRLQQLLLWYSQTKPIDEFGKALAELKAGEPADVFQYHLETLLVIIYEIEKNAKEQSKLKYVDMPEQPITPVQQ